MIISSFTHPHIVPHPYDIFFISGADTDIVFPFVLVDIKSYGFGFSATIYLKGCAMHNTDMSRHLHNSHDTFTLTGYDVLVYVKVS